MQTRFWLGTVAMALCAAVSFASGCGDDAPQSAQGASTASSGSGAGSGQGGAASTGAGAQGGSAGAAAGAGGGGGSGGEGGAPSVDPECSAVADCQLVDNCCDCMGFPSGQMPPVCTEVCIQDKCSEKLVPMAKAACEVGRCVLDVSCDPAEALCDVIPPACPAGQAPAVVNGCWGGCLPVTECASVGDCGVCSAAGAVCVVEQTQLGPVHHCVETPKGCESSPDCSCMGSSVCLPPFDTCSDPSSGRLDCTCINC